MQRTRRRDLRRRLTLRRCRMPLGAAVLVAVAAVVLVVTRHHEAPMARWPGRVTTELSLESTRRLPVVLEDDDETLFSTSMQRSAFLATLRVEGVSILRISSDWSTQAPDPNSPRPPRGFDAADPDAYPAAAMADLDTAVRAATARGFRVDIDIGFFAPRWATRSPLIADSAGANPYHDDISPADLSAYARMLATRYDGAFTPRGQSAPLPRVGLFEIWNEPNLPWDFRPQTDHGVAVSAGIYRAMVDAAVPAITSVDPQAVVLIGDTSSTGEGGGIEPLSFVEQLACVDSALAPIHTGGCAHFHALPAGGFADHPYEYTAAPWTLSSDRDSAEIGDLSRLQHLLDRLVGMHRLAPAAASLWLTEEGYQTDAQLHRASPWDEAQQAQFLAISEYEAWSDSRAVSFSQFLLRDTRVRTALLAIRHGRRAPPGTWTTGLEREDGTPKPALAMLASPVVARPLAESRGCQAIEVWAHVQSDVVRRLPARVQFAARSGRFATVARVLSGADGIIDAVLADAGPRPARVRVLFRTATGTVVTPAAVPNALAGQPRPPGIPAQVACRPGHG